MGARPLRRAIQRYIEDPLADFVLRSELPAGATVLVDRDDTAKTGDGEADRPEVKLTIIKGEPRVPATVGAPDDEADDDEAATDVPSGDAARVAAGPRSSCDEGRPRGRPSSFSEQS